MTSIKNKWETLENRTLFSVALNSAGWTVITPPGGARVIYCSSSTGSDSNNGLSSQQPVKSLQVAMSLLQNDSGDELLLKAGDKWQGGFGNWTLSGESAQDPMVIGSYGTGARPIIMSGTANGLTTGSSSVPDVSNLAIMGIEFWANGRDPNFTATPDASVSSTGIDILTQGSDILIENCQIQDYAFNINAEAYYGTPQDIQVRRNVVIYAYATTTHSEGLYANGVDGLLLDGNVFDENGFNNEVPGAVATWYNHDIYLASDNTGCIVENNIISGAAGYGLEARSGGVVEDNVFINDPVGMSFGLVNGATSTPGGVSGTVTGNVFIGGGDIGSVQGGQALVIGNIRPDSGTVISDNIFTQGMANAEPAIALTYGIGQQNPQDSVGINDLTLSDNVIYDWTTGINVTSATPGGTGLTAFNDVNFIDNDFENLSGPALLHNDALYTSQETWTGNEYYNADQWKVNGATVAPQGTISAAPLPFADPTRSVASYDQSLGGPGTTNDFLTLARQQSEQNWNPAYEGNAVAAYISAGFGKTTATTPPSTGGTTITPPSTGGSTSTPPSTGGTTGGTTSTPPSTGGTTTTPPSTGGTTSTPPSTGGTTSTPPSTGGTTSTPPSTGGTTSTPPSTGGTTSTPPSTGSTTSTPPSNGGTTSTPPPSVGSSPAPSSSPAPVFGTYEHKPWIEYQQVDFGAAATHITATITKPAKVNGSIQIRIGGPNGKLIGSIAIALFRTKNNYTLTRKIKKTAGLQDVYLVFVGRKDAVVVNGILFA